MRRRPPRSTLLPCTTLFRSGWPATGAAGRWGISGPVASPPSDPARSAASAERARPSGLAAEVDLVLHHVMEVGALGRDDGPHRQLAPAAQIVRVHQALDLALRGDAELLEELAQRDVEWVRFGVLGHG